MKEIVAFLTFDTLISPALLIVVYYLGAIGVPVGSWLLVSWLRRNYWMAEKAIDSGSEVLRTVTPERYRIRALIVFVLIFLTLEIMWRMMFEFLLAYFQIRDALVGA